VFHTENCTLLFLEVSKEAKEVHFSARRYSLVTLGHGAAVLSSLNRSPYPRDEVLQLLF